MRHKTRPITRRNSYRPYGGRRSAPLWLRVVVLLLAIVIACFCVLECVIFANGRTEVNGEPEVMVIFGCKMETWGPSTLLQDRLDTALDYLADHPDMTVIVTGGKGDDEHLSEAQGMYDYLTAHGIEGERIVKEDQSQNTYQNIRNTLALVQAGEAPNTGKWLLVSSDFHLARIKLLWGRIWEGTYTLSTLAAPCSHVPSRVKMFFREPPALVKSFLLDR